VATKVKTPPAPAADTESAPSGGAPDTPDDMPENMPAGMAGMSRAMQERARQVQQKARLKSGRGTPTKNSD
jgi:hypothetical protein